MFVMGACLKCSLVMVSIVLAQPPKKGAAVAATSDQPPRFKYLSIRPPTPASLAVLAIYFSLSTDLGADNML
jgi:hypothetical protein